MKNHYSRKVKETAVTMLDMGCSYATVARALRQQFPEDAPRIDHGVVRTWNRKYREGKVPMMYMKHVDPEVFLSALDMAQEGIATRQIAINIKSQYNVIISHTTICGWIKEQLPDRANLRGRPHDAMWKEKIRLSGIRYAINNTNNTDVLRRRLDKIKSAREIFDIQERLIFNRLQTLGEQVNWPEDMSVTLP